MKKRNKVLLVALSFTLLLLPTYSLAVTFLIANENDVVGKIRVVKAKKGDTLLKIARRFNIGKHEILQANPRLKRRRLKIDQSVVVPQLFILPNPEYRQGIVINMPELRLYYFADEGKKVSTFPVALGRLGWRTPTTITAIRDKKANPTWYVPDSIREHTYNKTGRMLPDFIRPGPKNPLGKYAMYLERRGYLIHGTNNPSSIGTLASSGCIRMHNADIEQLFHQINPGDPVSITNHAYKAGWRNNTLYLEAHEPVSHNEMMTALNFTSVEDVITRATLYRRFSIDWKKVEKVAKEKTGIPTPVGSSYG